MKPDRWLKFRSDDKNKKKSHERQLLTQKEIIDLRNRLEEKRKTPSYSYEVDHRHHGDARSIHRGHGLDYDESRPYYPGDELRFMNWRATARSGEPQMKVFRDERKPAVFIIVDRRNSMRFGTKRRLKVSQAVRAAATIAFDAHLHNVPVAGGLLQSHHTSRTEKQRKSSLSWIPESNNEGGVFNFINACNQPCPPNEGSGVTDESSLCEVIKLLIPMLAQGSRVVLISDFHDLDKTCRSSLLELAMQHPVQAIQIIDPAEISLPPCGNLLLQSSEQSICAISSSEKQMRNRYQLAAEDFLSSKQFLFRSLGICSQTLMTSDSDIAGILKV